MRYWIALSAVLFVGRDRSGTPRYAHVRGTADPFRQDIAGFDKSYPFRYEGNGNQLFVFEAPIDLLSFICLYPQDLSLIHIYIIATYQDLAKEYSISQPEFWQSTETDMMLSLIHI